jgi:hypothetical protein
LIPRISVFGVKAGTLKLLPRCCQAADLIALRHKLAKLALDDVGV